MADLFTPAAPPPPPSVTVTPPDSLNLYLRDRFGVPEAWRWVELDRSDDAAPAGFGRVRGAVCPNRRDGGPAWDRRDRATERTLFIEFSDWARWEESLALSRGVCRQCWGSGQEFAGWSKAEGRKTRTCGRCGGSGKPSPVGPAKEAP